MAVTDPVDARLLSALAEVGKVAVHELAAKLGMDPRDVAYRLVTLSARGLPLLVGVESDPAGLRNALAQAPAAATSNPPPRSNPVVAGPARSGPYQVHGTPSGPHAVGSPGMSNAVHGPPSGAYPVHGTPSGPHPVHGTPSGAYPAPGTPSGQYPGAPQPRAGAMPQHATPPAPPQPDPVMNTWGPPQSALWARGDQLPVSATPAIAEGRKHGRPGDVLDTAGLEGEQLSVQLIEVQDPADFLFSAAGYSLRDGERAVVVHTEITNRGPIPFASLPDNYLELLTADGEAIAKAPVSLTSRPPHKIGVQVGETCGGHTVYILSDAVPVTAVRWSPRPEVGEHSLTWDLDG